MMFDHEYVGNIHIHSIHSDGTGSYAEIAGKAKKEGLDFICINDHDYMLKSFNLDQEGFYGDLPLFIGLEIGRRHHHYLAFDVKDSGNYDNLPPQVVIDKVNNQGGFGFLAHPFEKGMPFVEKSIAYTWEDLSVKGYAGICIWNFSSRWKERVKTVFHGLFFMAFKSRTLKGPSSETLSFWDQSCMERRTHAVGGSDVHGAVFKWGPIKIIPLTYDYLLGTINIHVFIKNRIYKDFKTAKKDIYEAMREGRLFIANDRLAPARGFTCMFVSDDGSDMVMGEEGFYQPGNILVELPDHGDIRLIRNGVHIHSREGTEALFKIKDKGVYRIEVHRKVRFFGWRPWIFSNPFYLR